MSLPTFTIVTPSFNQAAYLEQTIRSVLDQKYPNLQYIIIDGGSSDGSVEIIKRYASHLDYWISEPDRGQSHALNKGFARAGGDILGFINSDDGFYPGALHTVAELYQQGSSWIVGHVDILEQDGTRAPQVLHPLATPIDWFFTNPIPQQGTFWAAQYTKQLGPFSEDLRYTFDYDFWMRLRFRANLMPHILPSPLAWFRMHAASKTVAEGTSFTAENMQIRKRFISVFPRSQQRDVMRQVRRRISQWQQQLGWAALKRGQARTARTHARVAIRQSPTDLQSWRLLYCAMRGH